MRRWLIGFVLLILVSARLNAEESGCWKPLRSLSIWERIARPMSTDVKEFVAKLKTDVKGERARNVAILGFAYPRIERLTLFDVIKLSRMMRAVRHQTGELEYLNSWTASDWARPLLLRFIVLRYQHLSPAEAFYLLWKTKMPYPLYKALFDLYSELRSTSSQP